MEQQQQQFKQIASIRQRHPPAVPFLWEERPGTPKHHWKLDTTAATIPPPHAPLKLIASVPFEWEELPGKPLSCFSHPPPENIEQQILSVLALPPPPPTFYSEDIIPLLSEDHDNGYYVLQSETEESSCSNNPTVDLNTVPILTDWNSSPSSQESESEDDGSYAAAAGGASLVGVSFLERLFPLLSSHHCCLRQNAGSSYSEIGTSNAASAITKPQEEEKANGESKACVAVRRAHTLGELIMMSRRISRKRKAIQIQKQGLSMEVAEKSGICMGGCMFGVMDKLGGRINWNWNQNWNQNWNGKMKKTHFHQLKYM